MAGEKLEQLRGKRVLLIAPTFFHYAKEIEDALDRHGIMYTFLNDRAKPGFFWKVVTRYTPRLNEAAVAKQLEHVCQEQAFDALIVVKGECVSSQMFDVFEKYNPKSPTYLYLWDSIQNSSHAFRFRDRFTQICTFDSGDAQKYQIKFLPLFVGMQFDPQNLIEASVHDSKHYDLMFVGTAHSVRSRILNQVEKAATEQGLTFFDFRFVQNKLIYLIRYLTNSDFRQTPKALIHTQPIPMTEVKDVMDHSDVIVDVTHPKQTGLTGRVVEALAMGRKVITTNRLIVDYSVIDMRDVLLIPDQLDQLTESFASAPFYGNADEIYQYFSVEHWLEEMLAKSFSISPIEG